MSLLYKECARIVSLVIAGKGSVKTLCLSTRNKAKTKVYAIVFNVLQNHAALTDIAKAGELKADPFTLVHLYELLYRGSLKTGGRIKSELMGKLPLLKEAKTRVETRGVKSRVRIPLYVRINTLKIGDVHNVEKQLRHDFPNVDFSRDDHVEMLYKFPPSTNFSRCSLYRRGEIILQDKASCMPAAVLNPPLHATVLDACSAPGNKTLHLSALMGSTGRVFAVERDSKRFRKLLGNVSRHGATNITPVQSDFLAIDPQQDPYSGVTHILVDPSCSGSGMLTERLLSEINPTPQCDITALSQLQTKLLTHALSFPSVRRVVYSTCSIYAEENERVVMHVLNSCSGDWELEHVLPTWERRGDVTVFGEAYKCVRCLPQDGTNGFFLACFRRIESNDGEVEGMKIQNLFSVGNLNMRFKLKHHYKISHKFIRISSR